MWFRGIELDIGESLHQVSSLSPLDGFVTFTSRFCAAWTYRGITKGTSGSNYRAWTMLTLIIKAKVKLMIVSIGSVR